MSNNDKENVAGNKATPKTGFGITAETKESNAIKVLPPISIEPNRVFPHGYKFPIVNLVNVIAKDKFETKNGETQVVQFVFKDKEGRQYVRTEWAQDPTEEKYKDKMIALNSRVKHMYVQLYPSFPKDGIGVDAKGFFEYFEAIEKAFKDNAETSKVPLFIKLIYFNGNLDFPYSPNFLQKAGKDVICKLEVNLRYDTIKQTESAAGGIPGLPGAGAGDDINFDNEYN